MDNLGDILYVLAMIAAVVFSAIKKQRQAKKQAPIPSEANQPTEANDDVFEELKELFQNKEPKIVKKPLEKPKPKPLHAQKKSVQIKPKTVTKPVDLKADEEENIGFEFDTEQIDLRQALIHSEILNRPYQ